MRAVCPRPQVRCRTPVPRSRCPEEGVLAPALKGGDNGADGPVIGCTSARPPLPPTRRVPARPPCRSDCTTDGEIELAGQLAETHSLRPTRLDHLHANLMARPNHCLQCFVRGGGASIDGFAEKAPSMLIPERSDF